MKRIIAILLTVLLLGMLTACDQNVGRHEIRARFDSTNGFWRISFHEKNSSASVKDIIMTLEGKILDDEYLKLKEVP